MAKLPDFKRGMRLRDISSADMNYLVSQVARRLSVGPGLQMSQTQMGVRISLAPVKKTIEKKPQLLFEIGVVVEIMQASVIKVRNINRHEVDDQPWDGTWTLDSESTDRNVFVSPQAAPVDYEKLIINIDDPLDVNSVTGIIESRVTPVLIYKIDDVPFVMSLWRIRPKTADTTRPPGVCT